ncbi:MAG TPA: ABC transporter permease [Candidatus Limnocylindrales bacterium]
MNSRLRAADVIPVATIGLRTRRGRAALSILGVTIGVAALVSVLGLTRSSQAELLARIDALGTNLLIVANGVGASGVESPLPATSAVTIARTDGVLAASATAALPGLHVYRNDRVGAGRHGGLAVRAADPALLSTLDGELAAGVFLSGPASLYPAAVLGYDAAQHLGIAGVAGPPLVWLGERWYTVIGVLRPLELAPEIDNSALIGQPAAAKDFGYDGHPTRIYVRTETERTFDVRHLLPRATDPQNPVAVAVSRPTDALDARLAAADATTGLFLGLSAIALLVGGIGIANVMVIAVLERRTEIGLRRALGATRGHVATQFLVESVILGAAGGTLGILLGGGVVYALAYQQNWQPLIPPAAAVGGLAAAIAVGALGGLYPALRAAYLPPTEALRSA